jgi:L-threonylcarbamoyladenylate synthase
MANIIKPSLSAAAKAAALLKKGKVIICPTDTVYGFLADASHKKAVDNIFTIKKRPTSKPLSLFIKNITMANNVAIINKKQSNILKKYWPGKYTFILEKKTNKKIYGVDKNTVALRIPKHIFLQKLLKKIDRPLVQTSVNISKQETLNSLEDILAVFEKNKLVSLIIDGGRIKNAKPSKIVDLISKKLTRLR